MRPLISVIIPCYNTAEYLPQCMQSLERQTIGIDNLQLIFVDDASTDDGKTWQCILNFERKHPDEVVAVGLEQNRCQGGARNEGLKYAAANYVGFIDSDDWIEPDMYRQLYEQMEQYHCDAVDCRIIVDTVDGYQIVYPQVKDRYDCYEKSIIEGGEHWWSEFISDMHYGGGIVTGIYRKSLIMNHQIWFPEHLKYEDNYWVAILLLYVKNYYHLSTDCYHYRQTASSTVHMRNGKHHFDQLKIEELKLQKYMELGIYERCRDKIERDFLDAYYCRTLKALFQKFDEPSFAFYQKIAARVRSLFPDYKNKSYAWEDDINRILLEMIDKQMDESQFEEIGEMVREYYGTRTKSALWRNKR